MSHAWEVSYPFLHYYLIRVTHSVIRLNSSYHNIILYMHRYGRTISNFDVAGRCIITWVLTDIRY